MSTRAGPGRGRREVQADEPQRIAPAERDRERVIAPVGRQRPGGQREHVAKRVRDLGERRVRARRGRSRRLGHPRRRDGLSGQPQPRGASGQRHARRRPGRREHPPQRRLGHRRQVRSQQHRRPRRARVEREQAAGAEIGAHRGHGGGDAWRAGDRRHCGEADRRRRVDPQVGARRERRLVPRGLPPAGIARQREGAGGDREHGEQHRSRAADGEPADLPARHGGADALAGGRDPVEALRRQRQQPYRDQG